MNVDDPRSVMFGARTVRHAVGPVNTDPIAHLTPKQGVAGHIKGSCLHVEQCVLDCAESLSDNAAGTRARRISQILSNVLMVHGTLPNQPMADLSDDICNARRSEIFIELAPAYGSVFGRDLQEVVVPPG